MPAEHRRPFRFENRGADDILVDETGILAALDYWRGYDEGGKVRDWIVNTVIPTVHVLLLRLQEAGRFPEIDPGSEREAFARPPTAVVADLVDRKQTPTAWLLGALIGLMPIRVGATREYALPPRRPSSSHFDLGCSA